MPKSYRPDIPCLSSKCFVVRTSGDRLYQQRYLVKVIIFVILDENQYRKPKVRIIARVGQNNKCSAVADIGDSLTTLDMGGKEGGGCCAPFGVS